MTQAEAPPVPAAAPVQDDFDDFLRGCPEGIHFKMVQVPYIHIHIYIYIYLCTSTMFVYMYYITMYSTVYMYMYITIA